MSADMGLGTRHALTSFNANWSMTKIRLQYWKANGEMTRDILKRRELVATEATFVFDKRSLSAFSWTVGVAVSRGGWGD